MAAALALTASTLGAGPPKDEAGKGEKLRIGTYDNRAVAVAYAASKFNPVRDKMAAYEKAKAANDEAQMKELRAWGERFQRQLHFQGFGHVPVGDLLAPVKDDVAALARRQRLAAVTMECDYTAANVELVDVTEDLVKLFAPSERTLKMAREVRQAKVVDLIKLADMPAKQ
jgi:hypothetical protein